MKMTFEELYCTALIMLLAAEGEFWSYYETDPEWWELRLLSRIN